MSATQVPEEITPRTRKSRWPWIVVAVIVGAVVLGGIGVAIALVVAMTRPVPEFASLVDNPDPALHGTVAYFDDQRMCVRVISASGQNAKDVYCMTEQPVASAEKEGKEVGVNLRWREDNRLEMTLFRMTGEGPNPTFTPAWQKVADIATGAMEEVPASDIPAVPISNEHPTRSPSGARIATTSDDGHAVVTLTDATGTRTLLDVRGPIETYSMADAYWAPNFEWIITSDNRVIVITPSDPSVTRVLVPAMTSFYGYDALSRYTVTSAELLTP